MRKLLLFFLMLQIAHCSCPSGFELVRDGECRGRYTTINANFDVGYSKAVSYCSGIQGQPVIIHNDEENAYWADLKRSGYYFVLGLTCISTDSHSQDGRWLWADGSEVDFKPKNYESALDANCKTGCSWVIEPDGQWWLYCQSGTMSLDISCTKQLLQPAGDGCESFADDGDDGICYQVGTNVQNWQDGQQYCGNLGAKLASIHNLEENSFVRRLAVSKGAVNGLFLGATIAGKGNQFAWIDGTDWDYTDFHDGFPLEGLGDCLAMDTLSTSGQWINTDCSSKLAVACSRKAVPRPECTSGPWKEGQTIYSPGYPYDASVACDYILTVATGKRVQVQVVLLEANTCCDRLILTDNLIGGAIVANLTGEISDRTYTTSSSNLMRVSWQPNGGVNVRGMMMSFRGV